MDGIGELIEKLCIANLKLWAVCDQKAAYVDGGEASAEKLRDLMKKDLDLCKVRAQLRAEINARLGGYQGDNVKSYGRTTAPLPSAPSPPPEPDAPASGSDA